MKSDQFDPTSQLQRLQTGSRTLDIELSFEQLRQFETYYQELVQWNRKFNLTAITEYDDVQAKHFLDSLAGLPILAEELGTPISLPASLHMVDVGTGAGFPAIPLKIAAPDLKMTLMDGTGKKIQFLKQLSDALALSSVEIVQGRAE